MHKKLKSIVIFFMSLVFPFLGSCGVVIDRDAYAKDRIETIISAINNKDSDTLKSLFSSNCFGGNGRFR